ncbi:MAG: hypothetical protein ACK41D_05485 [Rubricoccaceae bacterium]
MLTALIYLSLALIALSLLMMVGFGLRNGFARVRGESKLAIAAFVLPVLVLVIAYAVDGRWEAAFIVTAVVMAASGLLALLISGVRGLVQG